MEVIELLQLIKEPAGVGLALVLVFLLWREVRAVRVELLTLLNFHGERLTRLEDLQIVGHEK